MTDEHGLSELLRDLPVRVVAERIRTARLEAELTLDELGARIHSSRQHLIRLEKGQHKPRPRMLQSLADATGKPVDFFVPAEGGTTNEPFRDAA